MITLGLKCRPVENAFLLGGGARDGGYFCYEDDLFSEDPTKCYAALLRLRSSLIGSDRQKHAVVERGMLPRSSYCFFSFSMFEKKTH